MLYNTVNFRMRKFFKGKDEGHFIIHQGYKPGAGKMALKLRLGSCRGPGFGSQNTYWTAHSTRICRPLHIHAVQTDKQAYTNTQNLKTKKTF